MSTGHSSPLQHAQQATHHSHSEKARVGTLLVHGLNGSRHDLEELALFLRSHGMLAENMLLPGHGTHVREMFTLGWPQWAHAVREELHTLQQRCKKIILIGHSLGGALCLHTAAHTKIDGIITMCAPLHMFPWTKPAVRLAKRFVPALPTIREDVRDPVARQRHTRDVYRWTPMAPVESMLHHLPLVRAELPLVTAPALIMTALRDHVVPARDGREIYRLLGSQEKYLVNFHRSYHVLMKDYDRDEVFAKTLTFVQRCAGERRQAV